MIDSFYCKCPQRLQISSSKNPPHPWDSEKPSVGGMVWIFSGSPLNVTTLTFGKERIVALQQIIDMKKTFLLIYFIDFVHGTFADCPVLNKICKNLTNHQHLLSIDGPKGRLNFHTIQYKSCISIPFDFVDISCFTSMDLRLKALHLL